MTPASESELMEVTKVYFDISRPCLHHHETLFIRHAHFQLIDLNSTDGQGIFMRRIYL